MSVVVVSVTREVQRMQLKLSSWSLLRIEPLLLHENRLRMLYTKLYGRVGGCYT